MKMNEKVIILGAGPVGSLLACYLRMNGYHVEIFEKRPDMRKHQLDGGRSINLALSNRGWKALQQIGIGEEVRKLGIPMNGRMMHDMEGNLTFQSYGKKEEAIFSVSRSGLNELLITEAEKKGAIVHFDTECTGVDTQNSEATFKQKGSVLKKSADFLIGADGASSAMRKSMESLDHFEQSVTFLEHGYKELTILPVQNDYALDKNCLHIWPRNKFMLIALPNLDKTFTCTLFFALNGPLSFEEIEGDEKVMEYFNTYFTDAVPLMPNLLRDYRNNPTSKLATLQCFPWAEGNCLMIGDASHAIVPFYGQGMNSGFEDCSILNNMLKGSSLDKILDTFQRSRKPDADAIRDLALRNFIEMRDLVGDPKFLLRKKIEARLNDLFPEQWIPLYSMVTFSHIPYSEALRIGEKHDKIMDEVMQLPGIENQWENLDYKALIEKMKY